MWEINVCVVALRFYKIDWVWLVNTLGVFVYHIVIEFKDCYAFVSKHLIFFQSGEHFIATFELFEKLKQISFIFDFFFGYLVIYQSDLFICE